MVYDRLIQLCADICQRNGKTKLLWFGDKSKTLSYEPKPDEMVLTVHRWFANKSCPGSWMYARMGDLAEKVTTRLGGNYRIHTVVHGDTLWDIAVKYLGNGSRYPEIKALNGLKSNVIYSGMKLKIPN